MKADDTDARLRAVETALLEKLKPDRAALDTLARQRAQAVQGQGRRTVVFVDEVHRFNKSQQDAFLPYVEQGLVTFIGATTENPSFEVNSALLSRAAVYVLKPLDETEMGALFDRACERALADLSFDAAARELTREAARTVLALVSLLAWWAFSTACAAPLQTSFARL